MRVVLDTNVIVSSLISPQGVRSQVRHELAQGKYDLVVSEPILEEYRTALNYPKVVKKHGKSPKEIDIEVKMLQRFSITLEQEQIPTLDVVKDDPKDNKFVEAAAAAGAAYIVSGDPHLLDLIEYQGIKIITPSSFLALLLEENK